MGVTPIARQPKPLREYERLLYNVVNAGETRTDRTGVGTRSIFAPPPLRYNLTDLRVPLITSKQVYWRMALREFMWMLSGSTSVQVLRGTSPQMADIWANWANKQGDIGPTYGAQYRNAGAVEFTDGDDYHQQAPGVDQLARVVKQLTEQPDTRRALISLWSVAELDVMGIEPCMVLFQFSLRGENQDQLHVHVYQRSADMMLGVPFDLFQAGLLAHLVARELTMEGRRYIRATDLTWSAGDVHVYRNHIPAAHAQLEAATRAPRMNARLELPQQGDFRLLDNTLTAAHISVTGYHSAPAIAAGPIAV